MKVRVDEDVCVGTGDCEFVCPAVFKVVGGVSKVQADPVPPEDQDACRHAVLICPVQALEIRE